ncbi:MAG: hypothetical protein Q8M19_17215 [Reyranella sp.]|nr:hypothetical protein [Reyranella sp.]
MSCHPLIEAVLELQGAAAPILRKTGSHRERQNLNDAISDLMLRANEVAVRAIAAGHGELTVDVFAEVVKRAHAAGLPYPDMVAAFHRAQGGE